MDMAMPGRTWTAEGMAFLGMWTVMTAAMMLPSLVPMLIRYYRNVAGAGALRAGALAAVVAFGYFAVWVAIGALVFPVSMVVGRLPALGVGIIVTAAIAYQMTPRKARALACCRGMLAHRCSVDASARTAWYQGVRYGRRCARACANLMIIPVALGTMNLGVMVLVGMWIAAERLWPAGRPRRVGLCDAG